MRTKITIHGPEGIATIITDSSVLAVATVIGSALERDFEPYDAKIEPLASRLPDPESIAGLILRS